MFTKHNKFVFAGFTLILSWKTKYIEVNSVFLAAPTSQPAAELQRRLFTNGPSSEHKFKSGFSLEYFLGQNWAHCHGLEHVMLSPANRIRPVRTYLLPVQTDTFQLSRMYGLGGREYCPVSDETRYSSTGHQERNQDGDLQVNQYFLSLTIKNKKLLKNMRAKHSK